MEQLQKLRDDFRIHSPITFVDFCKSIVIYNKMKKSLVNIAFTFSLSLTLLLIGLKSIFLNCQFVPEMKRRQYIKELISTFTELLNYKQLTK